MATQAYRIGNAMEFFHDPGSGRDTRFTRGPSKGPGSFGYNKRLKDWKMQKEIQYQRGVEGRRSKKQRTEKLEDVESQRKFELEYQSKAKEPYRYDPTEREEMAAPIREGESRSLEAFAGTEELYRQMAKEGDPLSGGVQSQLYEKGRVGIDAGTMARKRGLAQHFRRGAPGGAALSMLGDIEEAGISEKTGLQRDIGLEAVLGKRKRMLELMGAGESLAGKKAGIIQRSSESLANIYKTTPTRKFT